MGFDDDGGGYSAFSIVLASLDALYMVDILLSFFTAFEDEVTRVMVRRHGAGIDSVGIA